jgi:hypothetical protein
MASKYLAGLAGAEVYERGKFLEADKAYKLKIVKTIFKTTRKKDKAFIAEFEVLESNSEKFPKGSKGTWYQSTKEENLAMSEIRKFFNAVAGEAVPDEEIEELVDDAIDNNALKGEIVMCQTEMIKTKEGDDFTVHEWSHVAA